MTKPDPRMEGVEPKRWRKRGQRYFGKDDSEIFNAIIFGAPAPRSMWAWGVWSQGRSDEGIEFSLASARKKADAVIAELRIAHDDE